MTGRAATEVDPVVRTGFTITRDDKVATAGSCFAQHVARTLREMDFNYLTTEVAPAFAFSGADNFGVFSARYGNVYTVRQLLQMFRRAYGLFSPEDTAWRRADGRFVDPFRPYVHDAGFASPQEVEDERESHLEAVRQVFEGCDVFVFTLGLTEGWQAVSDGAVFPLAPGVVGADVASDAYCFHNFTVAEMESDLSEFLKRLHRINPACRVLLTVSPVALIATYEDSHVLCANTYSKSALRVVAGQVAQAFDFVDYFPSYEIILGPQAGASFLAPDLREVTPEGVTYAMEVFARHYLGEGKGRPVCVTVAPTPEEVARQRAEMAKIASVICDEEKIDSRP
ncbi:GSCFA domain-containing protein [Asticcacaulis biprosthecium]|uniref:GSCFA domain-containing protein n=1 Tax=Asticcacaulis biprosthecium TaxID=76891 RepID=UPI0003140F14|nr:GSCFA domain-containing protein [Asticcacaulis biprosthecium]